MKSPAIFLPALLPLAVANPFSAQVGIEARIEARNVTDLANEVTGLASNITGLASNVTGVASDLTSLARGKPRRHRHADDRVPDFRKPCQCPEPTCPPMLNAKSLCECKNANAQNCYLKSNGGCPKPAVKTC